MQVAALPNVTQRNKIARRYMHYISLTSIQEGLGSPVMNPHLSTPRGTPPPDIPVHMIRFH
jgi:hypothetical protein